MGLRGLTRAAALELAGQGVRVNTVCPGLVETPMIMQPNAVHDAGRARLFYEGNRDATPLSRAAEADEIAGAVMFLLGPDASFITGSGPARRWRHDRGRRVLAYRESHRQSVDAACRGRRATGHGSLPYWPPP